MTSVVWNAVLDLSQMSAGVGRLWLTRCLVALITGLPLSSSSGIALSNGCSLLDGHARSITSGTVTGILPFKALKRWLHAILTRGGSMNIFGP